MTQYVQEKVAKLETPVTAWILLSMVMALSFMYAYFVFGTIQNTVAAKEMRSSATSISSSISDLEAYYLSQKTALDMSYAKSIGFAESDIPTLYVAKKSQASISYNR